VTRTRSAQFLAEVLGVCVLAVALFALLFPPPAFSGQRFPVDSPPHFFFPVVVAAVLTLLVRAKVGVKVIVAAGLLVPFLAEGAFVALLARRIPTYAGDLVWAFPPVNVRELATVLAPASLLAAVWAAFRASQRREAS